MKVLLLLFLSLLIIYVSSQTAEQFKNFLSSNTYTSYNKKIFPKVRQTEKLYVSLKFYLIAITSFDEIAGQLQLVGYIDVSWSNELLTWTTATNPITELLLPQDNFWKPSLVLSNSVESLEELGHSSYKMRVKNTGEHTWTVGVVSRTGCPVDVSFYPFDNQTCEVKFTPWGYYDNQVISIISSVCFSNLYFSFINATI